MPSVGDMTTSSPPVTPARDRSRLWSAAKLVVFDIAGPLAAYSLLRSAGLSTVSALILSGILPGVAVVAGLVRQRRLDAVGALVLAGIAVGSVLGLLSGNARLVLMEGSVPTAVFGVLCLVSLWSRRPLIYRFALEFIGADTPRGREFDGMWRYPGFRHAFRLFTVVWGATYLAEAAARIVIVETTSTGTALAVSKFMPYAVGAALAGWMVRYGRRARRRGERLAAAAGGGVRLGDQQPVPGGDDGVLADAHGEPALVHQAEDQARALVPDRAERLADRVLPGVHLGQDVPA